MAKLLLEIEGNAANSNSIVLRIELPVNPTSRPPAYLPKPEPRPPAVKPGTYRASGLVQGRLCRCLDYVELPATKFREAVTMGLAGG